MEEGRSRHKTATGQVLRPGKEKGDLNYDQAALAAPQEILQLEPSVDKPRRRRSWFQRRGLPLLLLAISLVTTTAIGARYMQNFLDGLPTLTSESDLWPWPWLFQDPSRFLLGWPFSLTLLTILITHEFGHYFACRAHGIRCTLPWVLPAPTLSGTAGAVIQIRGAIPTRRALMDVGVYGPLAGYVASLAAVAAGLLLSRTAPLDGPHPLVGFGQPLTLNLLHGVLGLFSTGAPSFRAALRHPVLIAGWVGLFITALNLIPAGQLDGGHILYALWPKWHRWVSRILPGVLLILGFCFWVGWILWGVLLWIPAMRHPRVSPEGKLGVGRAILAALALVIFLVTFTAEPFKDSSVWFYLRASMTN